MKPHWPCRAHVRNLPEVEGEENPTVEEDTHSVTEEPTQKTEPPWLAHYPGWDLRRGTQSPQPTLPSGLQGKRQLYRIVEGTEKNEGIASPHKKARIDSSLLFLGSLLGRFRAYPFSYGLWVLASLCQASRWARSFWEKLGVHFGGSHKAPHIHSRQVRYFS